MRQRQERRTLIKMSYWMKEEKERLNFGTNHNESYEKNEQEYLFTHSFIHSPTHSFVIKGHLHVPDISCID